MLFCCCLVSFGKGGHGIWITTVWGCHRYDFCHNKIKYKTKYIVMCTVLQTYWDISVHLWTCKYSNMLQFSFLSSKDKSQLQGINLLSVCSKKKGTWVLSCTWKRMIIVFVAYSTQNPCYSLFSHLVLMSELENWWNYYLNLSSPQQIVKLLHIK